MFKKLRKYISDVKIRHKGVIKLYFVYPERFKDSKIQSILSKGVESLVTEGIQISKNVTLSDHLKQFGKHIYIGWNTEITQCSKIGSFTSISHYVKIGLTNHALDHIGTSPLFYAKRRGWVDEDTFVEEDGLHTEIGADVLISANAIILKGVKIGHGAVIGAGTIVLNDVPPYAIVVGTPGKIIRYRFSEEIIKRLLASKWWELPTNELKEKRSLYNNVEAFLESIK